MKNLKLTFITWPVTAIAVIGLATLTKLVFEWCGHPLMEQNQIGLARDILVNTFASWKHFAAAMMILGETLIIAPILEELIFRWPTRFFKNKVVFGGAAVVFAAIFSAAHYLDYPHLFKTGMFNWMPLSDAFLALFAFALIQTWLYRKTKTIGAPMLNHALFNATNLVLLFLVG